MQQQCQKEKQKDRRYCNWPPHLQRWSEQEGLRERPEGTAPFYMDRVHGQNLLVCGLHEQHRILQQHKQLLPSRNTSTLGSPYVG